MDRFEASLLQPHRRLRRALAERPHDVGYHEFTGGHDMACWRGFWADGLARLLGRGRR